jgi:cell division protein FtsI (penicillin-binding protein 3)
MARTSRKWFKFRIMTLLVFFLILFAGLIARGFQLQVMSGKTYKAMADRQHKQSLQLHPERGMIFDRNGDKLAASILVDSVFVDPAQIEDSDKTAARLSSILDMQKKAILQQIASASKNFCWIARMINPDQAERIREMDLEGVHLIKEPKRFYPNRELAGQLIGFVGLDSTGLEGLEMKYESYLKGQSSKIAWERDARGRRLYMPERPASGKNEEDYHLVLTIDNRIQNLVEDHLKEAINRTRAKAGIAIVMDPRTGEILAMANEPAFNPNSFTRGAADIKKNKIITDCFDPGSTFKPFLVSAALDEKVVKDSDRFYCENGAYQVANRVIHEAQRKKHGILTVREIIKYSSNIGCAKISERLGKEKFHRYIKAFGFGAKTGIDLPGESPGLLRPYTEWTNVDADMIAFGQGISVTALQLVSALSAIANQGVLMKPYVVRKIVNTHGETIQEFQPTLIRRVISPETAKLMAGILTDVVGEEGGTGKNARISNVDVAGKTGTAQKFDFAAGKFSSERVRTSFMGFFPSEEPQFAILVSLDEPQLHKWGGEAAAPVFRSISQQIIRCFVTDIGESPTLEKWGADGPRTIKLISAPQIAPSESSAEAETENTVPDFRGLTVKKALRLAQERGINLKISGSGWAVDQKPAAGAPLKNIQSCMVHFSMEN